MLSAVTKMLETGGRHRRAFHRLALVYGVFLAQVDSTVAFAQTLFPVQTQQKLDPAKPLALMPHDRNQRVLTSTAFFVDGSGHMLTVRHAVENCARIVVTKEQHRIIARIVAQSPRYDLALLKVPKTLGLSAVFPRGVGPSNNDMVFAGGYSTLPGLQAGGGVLANARVTSSLGGSEAGHLAIDSPVTFGASGAPVLDKNGLVQGIVSRRTMVNRVLAVGAAEAKSFLVSNNVRIDEDDRPQLSGSASRAHRAASVSALVTCLQN